MNLILQHCYRRSKIFWIFFGLLAVAILGGLRHISEPDVAVSLMFLLPVVVVSWFAGAPSGYFIAAYAAGALLIEDRVFLRGHHGLGLAIVEEGSRFVMFLLAAYVLGRLRRSLESERLTARTDHLTGIPNRRGFFELAAAEVRRARRYPHPMSVVYLDADDFKAVNDTLGHSKGDALLRVVAETIRRNIRGIDVAGRLGGDEFAILLPETAREAARTVVGRLRSEILREMTRHNWPVTFSIGVVTFVDLKVDPEEMIHQADGMMYAAKNAGPGQIREMVFAHQGIPPMTGTGP